MIRRTRAAAPAIALAVIMLSAAGCGGGASEEDVQDAVAAALASQQASEPTSEAAPVTTEPSPEPPAPSPEPETVDFVMPNLVGATLQDAQNQIQTLGVFLSISHDMTGNRNQLLDANWRVCDQNPVAGTPVQGLASDWEGKVDFGAVKLEETCP